MRRNHRLAFFDLDKLTADNIEREEMAFATVGSEGVESDDDKGGPTKSKKILHRPTLFDPSLVDLDVPVSGAKEIFDQLEQQVESWQIIFLTSRPESMREATQNWLIKHGLAQQSQLEGEGGRGGEDEKTSILRPILMKPTEAAFNQSLPTPVWKAAQVAQLVADTGANEIIFADDQLTNIEAVKALNLPGLITWQSLDSITIETLSNPLVTSSNNSSTTTN